ncbi:hypothetical protein AVEN_73111-1 [Araneus ventricosus]|uniref:Pre-C2HC domain-containing protein n=1 Tax=Araneus ventricosus TaxID=182803 RepID=A0A4Y2IZH9_ARAVE|nr:hypothetical protein AVEN_73111-1 [Araneus ventricosus]
MRPSTSPVHERFFIAKIKDGSFNIVSAILIHKVIQANVGEVKSIKKCKNGYLLIEVWSEQQATAILKMKHIGNYEVTVIAHSRLNQSKGVISESELQNDTEDDILEELRAQNITAVKRILSKKEGKLLRTKKRILTFNLPSISKSVHIAYFNLSVRPYIPNPLRFFKCQRFGHTIQGCPGTQTFPRCSLPDHDGKTCNSTPRCINCKGNHPAYFKTCPRWKEEREIQILKVKQNLSFAEARKIVMDRTPKVGVSYAVAIKKIMVSTSTQYDPEPQPIENPTILVNNNSQNKSISNRKNLDKTADEPSPSKNKLASNEDTEHPLRGTSSPGVTGFTTPRYPSVLSPFEFSLPFSFCLFFPSLEGKRGGSPREAVAALFALCFSWTAKYPHVLAVRGDPLDGWYILVPGVSIGRYSSHLVGLLKGIKRKGHSLGLALRVVTVPGGDPERIGSG